MNKAELINYLADHEDIPKAQAERLLDALTTCLLSVLVAGGKATLPGLGKLEPVTRKGRWGRNPRSGERLYIEDHRSVTFAPGKALKDALNV